MLRGTLKYYDTELDREVLYDIWGYALQQSLKLVLKPLTAQSEHYFTDDTENQYRSISQKVKDL